MSSNILTIDKSSPVPAYYQIEVDLKKRIKMQEWNINGKLPAENDLAEQYCVSRVTIRQALAELEKDNIIRKVRGEGSFINSHPEPFITDLNYALITNGDLSKSSNTISATVLEERLLTGLFPTVCEQLHLLPSDEAIYIKRLYFLNEKPFAIEKSYITASLVPGFENLPLISNSISLTIKERYNLYVDHVEDYVEAVRATQSECQLLQSTYDVPMIMIMGTSYLKDGTPLEYSNTIWSGDAVRFHMILNHREGNNFVMKSTLE